MLPKQNGQKVSNDGKPQDRNSKKQFAYND